MILLLSFQKNFIHSTENCIRNLLHQSWQYQFDKTATLQKSVLDAISGQHLRSIYDFLYTDLTINGQEMSPFYDNYGHITLTGDLIGSVYPGLNAQLSAVAIDKGK